MIDADTVEAVWNQSNGVVQLFVNDALLMAMPQAQAREMANALLSAARVPDLAAIMAQPEIYAMQGDGGDGVNGKFAVLSQIAGTDTDNGFMRWSPDTPRDAVLREHYAR